MQALSMLDNVALNNSVLEPEPQKWGSGTSMSEKLLQFIWQFQYFNKTHLSTAAGEKLELIHPGKLNSNQGPDFTDARIKIGNTIFAGSVELHLKTSQWYMHGHQSDANYKNVILHVVYENDKVENHLPLLVLEPLISNILLNRYTGLMNSPSFIPCASSIAEVKELIWMSWKERLLAERLTRKSKIVEQFLEKNNYHWEETFWWMLARNFGMKVNAEAFEAMAHSLSVNLLAKHKSQIHQLEALLFGQAGLLNEDFKEDYPAMLKKEYNFLKKKYALQPVAVPVHFLRMRPTNFPSVRLAQLAMLIQNSAHLFSKILGTEKVSEIRSLFNVTANDYWHYHYRFDEISEFRKKNLGEVMINNIIINTIVPLVFAYGIYHNEVKYKDKALKWLEEVTAESNSITKGFIQLNIANKTAYDSQALIELKNEYCFHKRCLECSVGNAVLKNT